MLCDLVLGSIGVEVTEGQEEGLLFELERVVDVDQPVDEDVPHGVSNVSQPLGPLAVLGKTGTTCRRNI